MKPFLALSLLATLFALTAGQLYAQNSTTDETVQSISGIKRPTPKPNPTSTGPKKGLQAILTTDPKSDNSLGSFSATTPKIYLKWSDDSSVKGENLRVVWYSDAKNKKLSEDSKTLPGPNSFGDSFLIGPAGGFPPGKYRASLYENAKLVKSLTFAITK